jgi:hypothetical protein
VFKLLLEGKIGPVSNLNFAPIEQIVRGGQETTLFVGVVAKIVEEILLGTLL